MTFDLYTEAVLTHDLPEHYLEPLRSDEVLCARVLHSA